MDDRLSQFLIAVADLCAAAALAGLTVEITTGDGTLISGPPRSVRPGTGDDQVDDTGYARTFAVDASLVNLDDIVACTVRRPTGNA